MLNNSGCALVRQREVRSLHRFQETLPSAIMIHAVSKTLVRRCEAYAFRGTCCCLWSCKALRERQHPPANAWRPRVPGRLVLRPTSPMTRCPPRCGTYTRTWPCRDIGQAQWSNTSTGTSSHRSASWPTPIRLVVVIADQVHVACGEGHLPQVAQSRAMEHRHSPDLGGLRHCRHLETVQEPPHVCLDLTTNKPEASSKHIGQSIIATSEGRRILAASEPPVPEGFFRSARYHVPSPEACMPFCPSRFSPTAT